MLVGLDFVYLYFIFTLLLIDLFWRVDYISSSEGFVGVFGGP